MLGECDLLLFGARSSALLPPSTSAFVLIDPGVIDPKALLDGSPVFTSGTAAALCMLCEVPNSSGNDLVTVLASGRDGLLSSPVERSRSLV